MSFLTKENLKDWLDHDNYAGPRLDEESLERAIYLSERDNFLQIIYNYGPTFLYSLWSFFEHHEDYETCAIIRDTMNRYKKSVG